jgi:hypothetical protein
MRLWCLHKWVQTGVSLDQESLGIYGRRIYTCTKCGKEAVGGKVLLVAEGIGK